MKKFYTNPTIELNLVDIKDVITASLTNGGDNGTDMASLDWSDLDFSIK